MTKEQRMKNLTVPKENIDVVIDTDAYNEIDDQFAISYLLKSKEKLNTVALYAAPFFNSRSTSAGDGMEKSYHEIFKILDLAGEDVLKKHVFHGSDSFLTDEKTPVISPAAKDLVKRALNYSCEHPLYVAAIGAITDIASALLIEPGIAEHIVIVWLGGHGRHMPDTKEFNMVQDIAAARIVMNSGAPFVQLPCRGVVDHFSISGPELEFWLKGKNPLADYLAKNTVKEAEGYAKGTPWTRVIWDVTAIAWLLDERRKFMDSEILPTVLPDYNGFYEKVVQDIPMCYVSNIHRDAIMTDLIKKLA